jgi:hypothetical protein
METAKYVDDNFGAKMAHVGHGRDLHSNLGGVESIV